MDWIFDRLDGARVSDHLESYGGKVVVMENETLRVVCLPHKGADIVSFYYKPAGCECLASHARMMLSRTPDGVDHMKPIENAAYTWPEMFPVASNYGDYFGKDQPPHGEARLLSWRHDIIEDDPEQVAVKFQTRTKLSPFVLTRVMRIDRASPKVVFEEQVENLSDQSLPILWGHHPIFTSPFLDEHCEIILPPGKLVDGDKSMLKIKPAHTGTTNMFYLLEPAAGWYGLFNHRRQFGFGMKWDHRLFRTIWLWQAYNHDVRAPWFGRRYACALEPVTSVPKSHPKYGEFLPITVGPRGKLLTKLEAFIFDNEGDLGE